jgi:hypothetical protein
MGSVANNQGAFAIGTQDTASGKYSIAMGYRTLAIGEYSTALGSHTKANNNFSTALGDYTKAIGEYSTAMGSNTKAIGKYSTSAGLYSAATGDYSTALGYATKAEGNFSVAMGDATIAKSTCETVIGILNDTTASTNSIFLVPTDPLFIIGNGSFSNNTRHNAVTVLKNGKVGINSNTPSHLLTLNAYDNDTLLLRLIGPNGYFGYGAMLNFGDANNVYIQEFEDDYLKIYTRQNLILESKYGKIGVNTYSPDKTLTVNGDMRVTGDIYYGTSGSTTTYNKPDFVFKPNYNKNFNVNYIEKFIKKHGHLPWVTAAKDEKDGINMTRLSFETLEAVENIQLQVIDLSKENQNLKRENEYLKNKIKILEKRLSNLEKKIR